MLPQISNQRQNGVSCMSLCHFHMQVWRSSMWGRLEDSILSTYETRNVLTKHEAMRPAYTASPLTLLVLSCCTASCLSVKKVVCSTAGTVKHSKDSTVSFLRPSMFCALKTYGGSRNISFCCGDPCQEHAEREQRAHKTISLQTPNLSLDGFYFNLMWLKIKSSGQEGGQ